MKVTTTMFKKIAVFITTAVVLLTGVTITQINGSLFETPITVSAADNGTGNYRVNTGAGLNIRSGPGTGNSILGAATNGTQFTVTKTQNGWGYGSVRCTNGTKNGWACLQYCTFLGRNEPSPETPLENGAIYWISPACATGSVIDISGVGYNDGANAHLWGKVGGTDQKNQQFKAVKRSNYYIFEAAHSGKALDVDGGYTGNGRNIHQWTTHGGNNQCWYLYSAGNGYYYIRSKMNTGFSLDVNGAGSANGTNIHLWESNTTNAQKFKFTRVNTGGTTSSRDRFVNTALKEVGNYEWGNNNIKYNTWYWGHTINGSGYAWCDAYVSWCANQAGISKSIIPHYALVASTRNFYQNRGRFYKSKYYGGSYTPKKGDLVFYGNGGGSHIGIIIDSPKNGYLQTVEGNVYINGKWQVYKFTSNSNRKVNSSYVYGYASPNF